MESKEEMTQYEIDNKNTIVSWVSEFTDVKTVTFTNEPCDNEGNIKRTFIVPIPDYIRNCKKLTT